MLEDASTRQLTSDQSEDFAASQPWSMESYADGLMEELFSDIDQVLEGSGKLPSEPVKPEYVALQTIAMPQIVLPTTVLPTEPVVYQQPQNQLSTVVVQTREPRPSGNWFLKILFGAACASVAIAAIFWVVSQQGRPPQIASAPAATPLAPVRSPQQADAEFVEYMLQALDAIDQKQQQTSIQAASGTPPTQPPGNSPLVPAAPNAAAQPVNRPVTVLERVYIPVYQPPQPPRYAPPRIPPAPAQPRSAAPRPAATRKATATRPAPTATRTAAAVRPAAPKPATPKPKPATAKPTAVAARTAAPTATAKPTAVAARPAAPKPAAPKPTAAVRPTATLRAPQPIVLPPPPPVVVAPPPAAPVANNTLVGLLKANSADQSAALFNIDGVTRRLQVGENIGSSGWTLVEVTDQEAIIRRNGEVRSIYAGQKF